MSSIAEKIDLFAAKNNMSRRKLAQAAKIAPSTLQSAMERDKNYSTDLLQKIAKALKVPVGCLFDDGDIDSEYEQLCNILESAGICLKEYGFNSGGGSQNDIMLISHTDAMDETIKIKYCDLVSIVKNILSDADKKKAAYIQKRLNLELF